MIENEFSMIQNCLIYQINLLKSLIKKIVILYLIIQIIKYSVIFRIILQIFMAPFQNENDSRKTVIQVVTPNDANFFQI